MTWCVWYNYCRAHLESVLDVPPLQHRSNMLHQKRMVLLVNCSISSQPLSHVMEVKTIHAQLAKTYSYTSPIKHKVVRLPAAYIINDLHICRSRLVQLLCWSQWWQYSRCSKGLLWRWSNLHWPCRIWNCRKNKCMLIAYNPPFVGSAMQRATEFK